MDSTSLTRAVAVLIATALLGGAVFAGLAGADPTRDPGEGSSGVSTDTSYTPKAQGIETAQRFGWSQVAGASFVGNNRNDHYDDSFSPVPTNVDFYAVSFVNPDNGLAGGAACADEGSDEQHLRDCKRVPVIYRYARWGAPNEPATWRRVFLGADAGYVGAVGWVNGRKAVAVGGTGCYPRREDPKYRCGANGANAVAWPPSRSPAKQDKIAGRGLAWVMEGRDWQPINGLPAEMTGLTALAFSPRVPDCKAVSECGFAGGLGQVWTWKDGRFRSTAPTNYCSTYVMGCPPPPPSDITGTPPPAPADGSSIPADNDSPFRVRKIAIHPGSVRYVAAVTSGCCYDSAGTVPASVANYPRLMALGDSGWTVTSIITKPLLNSRTDPRRAAALPDSLYGAAWGVTPNGARICLSVVASQGGPVDATTAPHEPGGRVIGPFCGGGTNIPGTGLLLDGEQQDTTISDLATKWPELDSARLNAGEGDISTHSANILEKVRLGTENTGGELRPAGSDALLDWAVGELTSTNQAVAYTTNAKRYGLDAPYPLSCPQNPTLGQDGAPYVTPECKVGDAQSVQSQTTSNNVLMLLPSFPLNAYGVVGDTGAAWAAGDRGALLRRGGDAAEGGTKVDAGNPPKLGGGDATRLSDRAAYDPFRPILSTEPGIVPPLGAQPPLAGPGGRVVPYGSGDPQPPSDHAGSVVAIAMSRDGTEGWAVGPSPNQSGSDSSTLEHFDGTRWSKCDPQGVDGVFAADAACAGIADVLSYGGTGARLLTIARVRNEYGNDPSKADDFEAVAIARYPSGGPADTVLRYRKGRWSVDREWSGQLAPTTNGSGNIEIAFGGPDDGWLIATTGNQVASSRQLLMHLDRDGWVACNSGTGHDADKPVVPLAPRCLDGKSAVPLGVADDPVNPDSHGTVTGLRLTTNGSRVYLYGSRSTTGGSTSTSSKDTWPVILSEDSHGGDGRSWEKVYDPKSECGASCPEQHGQLNSLSVVMGPDGKTRGWGLGDFGQATQAVDAAGVNGRVSTDGHTPLLHLESDAQKWAPFPKPGAAALEYLLPSTTTRSPLPQTFNNEIVAISGPGGFDSAVALQSRDTHIPTHPMVWRNPDNGQWEPFATPFTMSGPGRDAIQAAGVSVIAPDNRGGLWLAANQQYVSGSWFYRYTTHPAAPVFSEVAHPIREPITASAAGGDGSLWVATESGTVYRRDRATGWDRISTKGWDAGVVQSPAYGIAVGEDGQGLIVGKAGRIAVLSPRSIRLDPAAVTCSSQPAACATTSTLRAVAMAPDGAALAGGDARALIWRPTGGTFQKIAPPEMAPSTAITSISMPTGNRAWLGTSRGDVVKGTLSGGGWAWARENLDRDGGSLSRDALGRSLAVRSVAVDGNGHGYAVGDKGLLLERTADAAHPWRRIAGYWEDLRTVTLGSGGHGALIGGEAGLILTQVAGHFEVARSSDIFDPLMLSTGLSQVHGSVVGVALVPGSKPGDIEAWAATQADPSPGARNPPPGGILHYTSNPGDQLMAGGSSQVKPLPDSPSRQPGEIELAAFGKSDCRFEASTRLQPDTCPELTGSGLANDLTARRVRDALIDASSRRPDLAIFTGDANDVAGARERTLVNDPTAASIQHERWSELIASPLQRAGIPVYGALGAQDLTQHRVCEPAARSTCVDPSVRALNLAWRQAHANAPAPWGAGDRPTSGTGLTFEPATGSSGTPVDNVLPGGARTHYAVDAKRDRKKVLRLVVLDTSLKTAAGAAGVQNPAEEQLTWLDNVLSEAGGRDAGEPAVVVSETPSYAYNNGAGATTDTLLESAAFETILVRNQVTAVVSGRLGWNGLYWLAAPGLHSPCPGGSYRPNPPRNISDLCDTSSDSPTGAADSVADTLNGASLGAPATIPHSSDVLTNVAGGGTLANIPVAIAASAGGKFGPDGTGSGSASQGFWRGYTRLRINPGAKNKEQVIAIEQRPVFDWIGIDASEHTLSPGRHLKINGYGREPLGTDQPARYDDIDGPAITHRYDLVLADPANPTVPKVDPTSELEHGYVPVPPEMGASIDRDTGVVAYSGRGDHPPVYALAVLSVGDKAAAWPLVLAPRRSFKALPPLRNRSRSLPPPPLVKTAQVARLPQTSPPPTLNPPSLNLNFPAPPPLPNLTAGTPQTQAPPPPAPPPPPVSPAASALQLTTAPVGLNVAPATTVIPPPAPPIQPAPPGGARREARQRQAAAAKSEEGGDQGAGNESSSGGDNANASSRLGSGRDLAFTAHEHRAQASAWSRDLLYGGGLGVAALTLALGWTLARPGPRRRRPEIPAPAWSPTRRGP